MDVCVDGKQVSGIPDVCNATQVEGNIHLRLPDLGDTVVEYVHSTYSTIFGTLEYDVVARPSSVRLLCLRPGDSQFPVGGTLLNMSIDFARKTLVMPEPEFISLFVHGMIPRHQLSVNYYCPHPIGCPQVPVPTIMNLGLDVPEFDIDHIHFPDLDQTVPQFDIFDDDDLWIPEEVMMVGQHQQQHMNTSHHTEEEKNNTTTEEDDPEIHGMDASKEYEIRLHGSSYRTRDFIPFMKMEIRYPEDVEREINSYLGDYDRYFVVGVDQRHFTVSKLGLIVYISEKCI